MLLDGEEGQHPALLERRDRLGPQAAVCEGEGLVGDGVGIDGDDVFLGFEDGGEGGPARGGARGGGRARVEGSISLFSLLVERRVRGRVGGVE